ncbi:hypothetical protein OIU77_005236 [Salix suchowensis]|uniref:B-like cyclin n=1 Tax=Salix suchowensis TaxID=1278906 RepID=A0ABQ9ANV9_9ROSI|nr:hypothetical protein OIU77_005236 [Salix suchowensis]
MEISPAQQDVKEKLAEELSKIRMGEAQDFTSPAKLEDKQQSDCYGTGGGVADPRLLIPLSTKTSGVERSLKKEEREISEKMDTSVGVSVVDIDSNIKDPQLCSFYAPDIYNIICAKELDRRPSIDYMEKLQRDISPSMRGILIDWLVEVSEEYTLVPDTLYLTVNLIDRFLSQNYIEKQRLQLLGVACMLIASKYEEICAPRVEDFCLITDNTYTRGEVLRNGESSPEFLALSVISSHHEIIFEIHPSSTSF